MHATTDPQEHLVFVVPPALPPVPTEKADRARILLDRRLGPSRVLTSPDSCERFVRDESEADGRIPHAVVLARSADDIRITLEVASQTGVPVTPRAGGTGRTGGAVPVAAGIVLSLAEMNHIKEIDPSDLLAVVEPGVILKDLHSEVEKLGLFYPPDPNSVDSCLLGGNVAENAGGPRAFKYGVTRDYVLGLHATLMGGTQIQTGRRTVKGVAGFDITGLLVGSEGTLAVFDEITLQLIPRPQAVLTVMGLFDSPRQATTAVSRMVANCVVPRCLELMDSGALDAIRSQGVGIDRRASALLLVDVDGDSDAVERELERVGEACDGAGAIEVLVAQDAAQRDRLWAARRELSRAIRQLSKNKLSEDVVVPRSRITDLLDAVSRSGEQHGVRTLSYGHAGDGNLHVNFLWDDDEQVPRVHAAIEAMMHSVLELKGTITGEHGIGVLKIPFLPWEQSADLIDLQRRIKDQFDPLGLLNPGKVFAGPHQAC